MKSTSSIGAVKKENASNELKLFLIASSLACFIILFLLVHQTNQDPYIQKTLELSGSVENGSRLYRMNCVGCHGITAQGLVGPELSKVTEELSDQTIIKQVINGLTPPMPSFEMEPQSMADILSYLHSLNM